MEHNRITKEFNIMNNLELIRLIAYTELLIEGNLGKESTETLSKLLTKLETAIKGGAKLTN